MEEYILALATAVVAFGAEFLRRYIKTKKVPTDIGTVLALARYSVEAAEQTVRAEDLRNLEHGDANQLKYRYATRTLQDLAKKFGIKLSRQQLDVFVESTVKEFKDAGLGSLNLPQLQVVEPGLGYQPPEDDDGEL